VDIYPYHDSWERQASNALSDFFTIHPIASEDTILSLAATKPNELSQALVARANCQVLDFRRASDFDAFHLPNSVNIPLETLRVGPSRGSPFVDPVGDTSMLEELWCELEALFSVKTADGGRNPSAEALMAILRGKKVLALCYDGDSARVANSVLRAKGVHSESVLGGYGALAAVRLPRREATEGVSNTVAPVGA
jgi:rhodanese-related sulfurtransferase